MNEPTAAESPCRRGAALHAEQHRPLLQTGQSRVQGDPPGTPIPMHPAPAPEPTGGPSSPRSPTPAACRPPGVPVPCPWAAQPPAPLTPPLPPRRALALSGGGGAGAGPWASAGAEDGVFPALSRSCRCLSSASPARCEGERWALRSRVGFRVVRGRGCWWGWGGCRGFRCPPLGGVTPPSTALSVLWKERKGIRQGEKGLWRGGPAGTARPQTPPPRPQHPKSCVPVAVFFTELCPLAVLLPLWDGCTPPGVPPLGKSCCTPTRRAPRWGPCPVGAAG